MAWTYSGDPSASDRDHVRFLIGDVDSSEQLLTDEEIAFALTEEPAPRLAAASCCDAIVAKWSRQVDTGMLSLNVNASQRIQNYRTLAAKLRADHYKRITPRFLGQSIGTKDTLAGDTDVPQPAFATGMHDNGSDS